MQTVYYYFLSLKIGNEHKMMFYRTQPKHELPRGKKCSSIYLIVFCLVYISRASVSHSLYILNLKQFNVACLYSCLFHFLFYKVNLILLQKYLHVTTVRVGI